MYARQIHPPHPARQWEVPHAVSLSRLQLQELHQVLTWRMDKKIPAILVLAALGTEVVFNEHHEPAVHQPHVEIAKTAGSATMSATIISPNPTKDAPTQPHIEGGGDKPATDVSMRQIS
jgi:hypothetical protein